MGTQESQPHSRRHTRAVLWLVVLGLALGVFLTGMIGTGMALGSDGGSDAPASVAHEGRP